MATLIIYWSSTALLSLLYLASAFLYIRKPAYVRQAQADLGFSAPFLVPFMIAIKILAPIAILSRLSVGLSDLAYAGVLYHLVLSALAHFGVRNARAAAPALIGMVLLALSYGTQNFARAEPSVYATALVNIIS